MQAGAFCSEVMRAFSRGEHMVTLDHTPHTKQASSGPSAQDRPGADAADRMRATVALVGGGGIASMPATPALLQTSSPVENQG